MLQVATATLPEQRSRDFYTDTSLLRASSRGLSAESRDPMFNNFGQWAPPETSSSLPSQMYSTDRLPFNIFDPSPLPLSTQMRGLSDSSLLSQLVPITSDPTYNPALLQLLRFNPQQPQQQQPPPQPQPQPSQRMLNIVPSNESSFSQLAEPPSVASLSPVSNDSSQDDDSSSEADEAPADEGPKKRRTKKGGTGFRKKSRPEVQRRKRSEMNERFETLKLLAVPDAEQSPAIGRGDRSTNSKEAILRIAAEKVSEYKDQIAALEAQIVERKRAARTTRRVSSNADVSSAHSRANVNWTFCFDNSAVSRLIITLDGTIIDFNNLFPPLLDTSLSYVQQLKRAGESAFSLFHSECLPSIFHNITVLLSGDKNVVQLIGCRTITTHLNRQCVFNIMTWCSQGDRVWNASMGQMQNTVVFENILVQTAWTPVPYGDTSKILPAPMS